MLIADEDWFMQLSLNIIIVGVLHVLVVAMPRYTLANTRRPGSIPILPPARQSLTIALVNGPRVDKRFVFKLRGEVSFLMVLVNF